MAMIKVQHVSIEEAATLSEMVEASLRDGEGEKFSYNHDSLEIRTTDGSPDGELTLISGEARVRAAFRGFDYEPAVVEFEINRSSNEDPEFGALEVVWDLKEQ